MKDLQSVPVSGQGNEASQLELKILLVEKNWPDQRLISKMLEIRGCMVSTVDNLPEAGNLLKSKDFDMVLIDINIFRNNGFDIKAVIQDCERNSGKHIAMIAMAENSLKPQRDYFMKIGMDAYIPKPVFEEELCREIEKLAETIEDVPDSTDPYECKPEQITAG